MNTDPLLHFIKERWKIHQKKEAGKPKPWTSDTILRSYRFCNVHRENDTVTKWIAENWRVNGSEDQDQDQDLWFAMVVARLVNWPETLEELQWEAVLDMNGTGVTRWRPKQFIRVMHARKAAGAKVFSGAYIVSTNGHAQDKAEYLAQHVLDPLWAARKTVRPQAGDTLQSFHTRLMGFGGMGSFMAAQVVADMKYVTPLSAATDWWTWAASGPGSRRGLNRVMERDLNAPWKEHEWLRNLHIVMGRLQGKVEAANIPRLHAQDYQNCLCETDKYLRTLNGEGKPRSTYPGV